MTMAEYEKLIMEKQRQWLGQGPRSEISTDLFLAIIYKQTAEWHQISETHLENVLQATRHFIEEALEHNLPKDIRSEGDEIYHHSTATYSSKVCKTTPGGAP